MKSIFLCSLFFCSSLCFAHSRSYTNSVAKRCVCHPTSKEHEDAEQKELYQKMGIVLNGLGAIATGAISIYNNKDNRENTGKQFQYMINAFVETCINATRSGLITQDLSEQDIADLADELTKNLAPLMLKRLQEIEQEHEHDHDLIG